MEHGIPAVVVVIKISFSLAGAKLFLFFLVQQHVTGGSVFPNGCLCVGNGRKRILSMEGYMFIRRSCSESRVFGWRVFRGEGVVLSSGEFRYGGMKKLSVCGP